MLADCVVEPTRTRLARLQLVVSPMCLYIIAARVSKPCGVVRAARAPTGLTTSRRVSARKVQLNTLASASAESCTHSQRPEPHAPHAANAPHDRMSMAR